MDSPINISDNLPPLIDFDEPPAFELIRGAADSPIVILCDHARNKTPRCLGLMGVTEEVFEKHIAYDIGAESVARELQRLFHGFLVIAGYSRLIIDLNRHPGDGSAIPEISDNIEIPANKQLSPDQVIQRENALFWPYHNTVTEQINKIQDKGRTPIILSIHSFTPEYRGYKRPWHIGVLWDQEKRISEPLIESLQSEPDICIGDNEPYHARNPLGFTMDVHCERNGHPHVLLEIRQDLINDNEKAENWAQLIHRHLAAVLQHTGLLPQP